MLLSLPEIFTPSDLLLKDFKIKIIKAMITLTTGCQIKFAVTLLHKKSNSE